MPAHRHPEEKRDTVTKSRHLEDSPLSKIRKQISSQLRILGEKLCCLLADGIGTASKYRAVVAIIRYIAEWRPFLHRNLQPSSSACVSRLCTCVCVCVCVCVCGDRILVSQHQERRASPPSGSFLEKIPHVGKKRIQARIKTRTSATTKTCHTSGSTRQISSHHNHATLRARARKSKNKHETSKDDARQWTSSGPSAKRSHRAPANAARSIVSCDRPIAPCA